MGNSMVDSSFVEKGGTELGCMSTSTSQSMAEDYAQSDQPLLFRIISISFMSRGADITWLSVYPNEQEILYPPISYLKFLKQTIQHSTRFVIDMEPEIG